MFGALYHACPCELVAQFSDTFIVILGGLCLVVLYSLPRKQSPLRKSRVAGLAGLAGEPAVGNGS